VERPTAATRRASRSTCVRMPAVRSYANSPRRRRSWSRAPARRDGRHGPVARTSCTQSIPKLVILRISGWGQDGRYRQQAGLRHVDRRLFGLRVDERLRRPRAGAAAMYLADCMAALNGYGAVLWRCARSRSTAERARCSTCRVRSAFSMLGPQAANHKLTGDVKVRSGSRSTNAAPRNVYKTNDGHWVCLSPRPRAWPSGCWSRSAGRSWSRIPASRPTSSGEETASSSTHHRRIRGRARSRREPEIFSTRPASRSGRSTTSRRSRRTTTCWSASR